MKELKREFMARRIREMMQEGIQRPWAHDKAENEWRGRRAQWSRMATLRAEGRID